LERSTVPVLNGHLQFDLGSDNQRERSFHPVASSIKA
jgi:hypothetical protein